MTHQSPITPPAIRYIKLGSGAAYAEEAFARGVLPLAFPEADHALCAAGDWVALEQSLVAQGRGARAAAGDLRELKEFYTLPDGTLFITMAQGHLHWCLAEGPVEAVSAPWDGGPQRERGTVDGWHRCAEDGAPLTLQSLSSVLTRTASYRRTLCRVEAEDYLLRRLSGTPHPAHARARVLTEEMEMLATQLISELHFAEVETLTDLIFARAGWQRTSVLGEEMPDVDLIVEEPILGESAWVQVKTGAEQAELDDYIRRFRQDASCDRFVFVCGSPRGALTLPGGDPRLQLWAGRGLAAKAIEAGLFGWLLTRTR